MPGGLTLAAFLAGSLLGTPSGAIAQPLDPDEPTEFPYERCLEAEAIGAIALPYVIEDALELGDESTQVDFVSLSVEPGTALVVELRGQSSGAGSLPDPLLGLFDTDCERLAFNDDWYSLDSRLEFTVPENGGFILAAAAFPDTEFDGSGSAFGSYRLSVIERPAPIHSIAVRLVDARSGEALRGDASPGARVTLLGCREEHLVCERYIVSLNANSEGRVRFDGTSAGSELLAGTYALVAEADDYASTRVGPFAVTPGQNYTVSDIALEPAPLTVLSSRPCGILPPLDSVCDYEVTVANNTDVTLRGMAWSLVEGWGIGAGLDRTVFEAGGGAEAGGERRVALELDGGERATLRFAFRVPSYVAARATFCTRLLIGLSPDPLTNTTKERSLFCVEKSAASLKGAGGFRLLSEHEASKRDPGRRVPLVGGMITPIR